MKKYNLIFLKSAKILLSSKEYSNWRQIQDEFENYQASIGFSELEEIVDYLKNDYKIKIDKAKSEVEKLNYSKSDTIEIEIPESDL